MIEFDAKAARLVLKLVYYGPALSGKTTNLLCLHDRLCNEGRGDLIMLDTTDDRTIYFDLLPFFYVVPSGMKIKLKVYTVPGQVRHDATRKAVLQRADGVVFVADSLRCQQSLNAASFENLEHNLSMVGLDIEKIPLVIQFNKQDLAETVTEKEIREIWKPTGLPVFMASALRGDGVMETFRAAAEKLFDYADSRFSLQTGYNVDRNNFVNTLVRQI